MRPTRLPRTMPCLWPRPERGMTIAASPGSSRWIASPEGTSAESPGRRVSGSSMHARRSSPAEPCVAYAGICARILSSSILMSSFFLFIFSSKAVFRRAAASRKQRRLQDLLDGSDRRGLRRAFAKPHGVVDDAIGDLRLRSARERVHAVVVVDRDLVLFLADGVLHQVRHDHRDLLADALFLRVAGQVLALRRA